MKYIKGAAEENFGGSSPGNSKSTQEPPPLMISSANPNPNASALKKIPYVVFVCLLAQIIIMNKYTTTAHGAKDAYNPPSFPLERSERNIYLLRGGTRMKTSRPSIVRSRRGKRIIGVVWKK